MPEKLSYCAQLVKDHDPDRFLIAMMLHDAYREDVLTLLAFNHEIAKTREVVSETQLGLIRLQWWRERLAEIYSPPSPGGSGAASGHVAAEHEILQPLSEIIKTRGLPREEFENLIYAREFDLEDVLPTHMEGLLHYADYTTTPLFSLIVRAMGEDPEQEVLHALATNYALAGILRAVPFHAAQRRCYLPGSLLEKYEVRKLYDPPKHQYAGAPGFKPTGDIEGVVKEVCENFNWDIIPENKFLKLSQKLALLYYKQLKSKGFNPFHPKMCLEPSFKALRLWAA